MTKFFKLAATTLALTFSLSACATSDIDDSKAVLVDNDKEIYQALNVEEKVAPVFILRPGVVKEKYVRDLSCLHFDYHDNGEQKYLCTFDDPGSLISLGRTYRDLYNALNVVPNITRTPDIKEPRNPEKIVSTKKAGNIECSEITQPPLEKIAYYCDLSKVRPLL